MGERQTRWLAEVVVVPKAGVNDPEGDAIRGGLHDLGYPEVERVTAGRFFRVVVTAATAEVARSQITETCDRLLANPVIEAYEVRQVERIAGAES